MRLVLGLVALLGLGANLPAETTAVRRIGPASARLTPRDLSQIERLVSGLGQPWLIIAKWPQRTIVDSWSWPAQVYFTPNSTTPGLSRGLAALVTATISSADGFDSEKTWQLEGGALAYAQVPAEGHTGLDVKSDRDLHRPFLTIDSATWGRTSDADLVRIVRTVRGAGHGPWPIAEIATMNTDLVTVDTLDAVASSNAGESSIVSRQNGTWQITHSQARPLPPSPDQDPFLRMRTRAENANEPMPTTVAPAVVIVVLGIGLAVFGFWIVFSAWRTGGGSPQFVLALLPLALMFLTAPVPIIVWQLIRGFGSIEAVGGVGSAAAVMIATNRSLLFGAAGFLLVMAAAAALQLHAGRVDNTATPVEGLPPPSRAAVWRTRAMLATPAVMIPVALLLATIDSLPRMTFGGALELMQRSGSTNREMEQLSQTVASLLMASFAGGIAATILVGLIGLASLLIVRTTRFSNRVTIYSWAICAIAIAAGLAHLSKLVADLRWLASQ